jgi:hypothetical protein
MSVEVPKFTIDNSVKINIVSIAHEVLKAGHAFHGYGFGANGEYRRVVNVMNTPDLGPQTPVIGRGEDDKIESALVRACYTFNQTRQFNVHHSSIIEGVIGDITPSMTEKSPFDHMLDHDAEFWVHKRGDEIVAGLSSEEIKDTKTFEATAPDALTAIESLVRMYHFRRKSAPKIIDTSPTLFR